MKILAIAPWVPTTRRPRARGLLKILAQKHELHLICLAWDDDEAVEAESIDFATVDVVRVSKLRGLAGVAFALFTGASLQQAYVSSNSVRKIIRKRAEEISPDVLYFNVIRSAHLVREVKHLNALRVLDMDETRSNYYKLISSSSSNYIWRIIAKLECRRMQHAEKLAAEEYDKILVSSPMDRRDFAATFLVRSPVDASVYSHAENAIVDAPNGRVVFVGRLSYYANVEAIIWFARKVWPLVVQAKPNAFLDIVGENPSKTIKLLASSTITVHGKVSEVAPFYRSANLSVVPVRYATGAQMKLIESMMIGTPTVVTSIVQRGLGVASGVHTCVPDGNERVWAANIVSLLENRKKSLDLSLEAQAWARQNYSEMAISSALEHAIQTTKTNVV